MKRRLIVDAQVFQTPAWHRGMGKYSRELLAALHTFNQRHLVWDQIEIILSSHFKADPAVLEAIATEVPSAKIITLPLLPDDIRNYHDIVAKNRQLLDVHVASLSGRYADEAKAIGFLILSPMQGGICSVFPSEPTVHKSLICYDLIPFMFPEIYFRNPIAKQENLNKFQELLKADTYLAISKTVANDLAVHLGVDAKRIVNIDGGPIRHSANQKRLKIPRPFILMPTGNELRKNNRLGMLGFAEFNKQHNNRYHLVITSFFDRDQVAELSQLSAQAIFTGNISGEELNYLYEHCEALLFPSEYEGLGLPVLEAVEKGKPVACSDISVFREMSNTAFHWFEPSFVTSIASALEASLTKTVDQAAYESILQTYTWQNTAQKMVDALQTTNVDAPQKLDLAVFGPDPKHNDLVAALIHRSHAELSRLFNLTYYLESLANDEMRPNMLPYIAEVHDISAEAPIYLAEERLCVYHLSNSARSAKRLFTALARPGIIILHDLALDEPWRALLDQGLITTSRYEAEVGLSQKHPVKGTQLLVSLLAYQSAVLVFNAWHKKQLEKLAAAIDRRLPIIVAEFPTSALVYNELIPQKSQSIVAPRLVDGSHPAAVFVEAEEPGYKKFAKVEPSAIGAHTEELKNEPLEAATDREYEKLLSRLNFTFCADDESAREALEGLRYGVIPLYLKSPDLHMSLPKGGVAIEGVGDLKKALRRLRPGSQAQLAAAQAIATAAGKTRSFERFAHQLRDLAESLKEKGG